MNKEELKEAIKQLSHSIEIAAEAGKPYPELMRMYKKIKELQYHLAHLEAGVEEADNRSR